MADVEKALGATGPVAMTGYVFSEGFAASHKDVLRRYFAAAAEARKILAEDPSAWAPIKARLRLKDDAALAVYRQRYLEGVPKRTIAEEAEDARILYRRLAAVGGEELVGDGQGARRPASSTIPRRVNSAWRRVSSRSSRSFACGRSPRISAIRGCFQARWRCSRR